METSARERLVVAYAPLVKYVAGAVELRVAGPCRGCGPDLLRVEGLLTAIERFDLTYAVKFETYAITRIRGEIIDELRKLDWVPAFGAGTGSGY